MFRMESPRETPPQSNLKIMQQTEFQELFARIKQGSEEALQEFLERFGRQLYREVRRRLNRRLRTKFDSEDFVQDVMKSFWSARVDLEFECPEQLITYLLSMARNKVVSEGRRRLQSDKRSILRECASFDERRDVPPEGSRLTASEVAIVHEEWSELTNTLPDYYSKILQLRLDGKTIEEIAQETGKHERTVRRVLQRIASRWDEE